MSFSGPKELRMSSSAWPDLSGLASLARDQRLDLRPVLLRVQTDLFVTAPARDRETIASFEALASGLLRTVDEHTAARVARKLARCPDTPESILGLLVSVGGEARRAVVENASSLPPGVVEAVLSAGGDLAEALAARPDLDGRSLDDLADLGEDGVDFALAMNRKIVLRGDALERLLDRARTRPALAQALLARDDLTAQEEASLYLQADSAQRTRIRARIEASAPYRPRAPERADEAAVARLVSFADSGDHDGFGALLAGRLGLDPAPDWRFDRPDRHDLLALALMAAGVPEEAAIHCFLTLHPAIAHSVYAVFDLAAIARTTPQAVAAGILEAIVGAPLGLRRSGRHAPAMDPSGAFGRPGGLAQPDRDRRPVQDRSRRAG